ncbi:MAG: tyrosine-type recombinase/integrase [Bifidobacterium sp.]
MPRPRLPIGSNGSISVKEVSPGVWRAITRYRFSNGKFRQVERRAASEAKARNALKRALLTIDNGVVGSISPDMRLSVLADRFMNEKRDRRSVGTVQTYQVAVDAHIKPDIGDLAIREATPERLGNFISLVAQDHGHGAAKNSRSVLSGMMALAVRNGAILHNPVAEIERIEKHGRPGSVAIPVSELGAFLDAIEHDEVLKRRGYVDLFRFIAGTGWRMGEACGLKWSAIDFDDGSITMCRIAKYVNGQGAVIQEFGKTHTSTRTIQAPTSVMTMLSQRKESQPENELDLVFPSSLGGVLDPNNAERALKQRRDDLGFPGVTSHSLRKCVATILDEHGLSARAIADYLGHSNPSMTQDVYMQRNLDSSTAASTLQQSLAGLIK